MKKIILFTILSIISLNMTHAQNCQLSEEAKHHWRRASAIAEDLKTSESYSKAIDEFMEVMILAPECPDVYYNLSWLYGQWAELDSYDKYRRLNNAELFLKVCLALNPANKEEAKNQLARLEIKREQTTGKYEDFLNRAYDCLKKGCKDALVDRFYQLHKFISKDNSRDKFEKYFLMARSADSHYKKKENEEAKEIYEEMLKSEFKDAYARKRYAELSPGSKKSVFSGETEYKELISDWKITSGGNVRVHGKKLKKHELQTAMSENPELFDQWKSGREISILGNIFIVIPPAGIGMKIMGISQKKEAINKFISQIDER